MVETRDLEKEAKPSLKLPGPIDWKFVTVTRLGTLIMVLRSMFPFPAPMRCQHIFTDNLPAMTSKVFADAQLT